MRPDKVGGQLAELFGDTSWVSGRRFVAQMTASGDLIGKSVFEDARKKALFMSDSGKDKYLSFLSASDISEDTVKKYIHFLEAHKYMSHASLDVTIFVLYQILDTPSGSTPSQLAINFIKEVDSSVTTFNRALQTLIEDGFIKSETSPGDRRFRKYFVTPKAMQLLEEISSTSIE